MIDGGTMPDARMAAKVCWRPNGLPNVSAWRDWRARSFVQLRSADDVAGGVAGLAQIQELFESDQLALRVRPAARHPAGVEFAGSCSGVLLTEVRDGEGAITSRRGACAPQSGSPFRQVAETKQAGSLCFPE